MSSRIGLKKRRHARAFGESLAAFAAALLHAALATAEPGTHALPISTWDTRASSVALGFRPGFLSGGHFDILSYNANFTATNGNLSSQFGIHYLNVRPGSGDAVRQGLGATAVALFSNPVGERYDSGIPKAAVAIYVGTAPTTLISSESASVSVPLLLGIGTPWSPSEAVTITPWIEGSPGLNLDTRIRTATVDLANTGTTVTGTPQNPQVMLSSAAISKILARTVDEHTSVTMGLRAGLDFAFRLSDSVDFDVSGALGSLGVALHGTTVAWIGGGLVFRWDKVVPTVLPPDSRLRNEDCGAVEERYRACQVPRGSSSGPAYPQPTPAYPQYPVYPAQSSPPTYSGYPAATPASPGAHPSPPHSPPRQPEPAARPSIPTGTFPP